MCYVFCYIINILSANKFYLLANPYYNFAGVTTAELTVKFTITSS